MLRERRGDGGAKAGGTVANLRFGARAFPGLDGLDQGLVDRAAERPGFRRDGHGFLDLPKDLGVAEDGGIKAGGDAEQMTGRLNAVKRVAMAIIAENRSMWPGFQQDTEECFDCRRLRRGGEIELGAVTSRKKERLKTWNGSGRGAEQCGGLVTAEAQPFADGDGRGAEAHSEQV